MPSRPTLFLAVLAAALLTTPAEAFRAQNSSPAVASAAAPQPPAGSNWHRVEALPARTKVHITTDHGGQTCRIFAVSDETLTCAGSGAAAGRILQRTEIRHIKLAHYGRSTLVGLGVGAGTGAVAGAIAGRTKPCTPPAGNTINFCGLGNIGLSAGGVAAVFGTVGGVLGAAIGGPTDFARGSSIYVRP